MITNKTIRTAFTLVELLVVISILTVITALIVPQLRTITKDRNIREAARVVGSIFNEAIQRAKTDGSAGIVIERNPNFIDTVDGTTQYAGSTIYLLRHVPPYSGDDIGSDTANVFPAAAPNSIQVVIPRPYEHDEAAGRRVIQVNDHIFFNNRSFGYRITSVVELSPPTFPSYQLALLIDLGSYPVPPQNVALPYVIHRQPRKLESSRIDLPRGHMIDLRFSGAYDTAANQMFFAQSNDPIKIFFDEEGRFDRIHYGNEVTQSLGTDLLATEPLQYIPNGSLYMFITQGEIGLVPGQDQLVDEDNLWVTVNDRNGNVSVGNSIPQLNPSALPTPPAEFLLRLNNSRGLARSRQAAAQ